jgi:hypothetical protein
MVAAVSEKRKEQGSDRLDALSGGSLENHRKIVWILLHDTAPGFDEASACLVEWRTGSPFRRNSEWRWKALDSAF